MNTHLVTRFVLEHFPVRSYFHDSKDKSDIEAPVVGLSPTESCSRASLGVPEMSESVKMDVMEEEESEHGRADEDALDIAGNSILF